MFVLTDDVTTQLQDLKSLCVRLQTAMVQAATELRESGTEPPVELLDQMRLCRAQFRDLKNRLGLSPDDQDAAPLTLNDLEQLLQLRERVGAALSVIDAAESLTHRTEPHFPPLERLQVECRELRDALSLPRPSSELIADLESGRHPVAAVVALVVHDDELSDELWSQRQSDVQSSFGRELATALARGRIVRSVPE